LGIADINLGIWVASRFSKIHLGMSMAVYPCAVELITRCSGILGGVLAVKIEQKLFSIVQKFTERI
jgi:hypothetical protein